MAVMVLAMLFIGVGMAASVSERYHLLVSIHEPLGIAILVLVVIRFINRLLSPPPPLPAHLALWQRLAARDVPLSALRADVRSAAGRLGDAFGRPISDRALRAAAAAAHIVP